MRVTQTRSLVAATLTFLLALTSGPILAYDSNDAKYVTGSNNAAVLYYVICLEAEVGNTPRNLSLDQALQQSERACSDKAAQLPRNEPSAEDIRLMILECGFSAEGASAD